MAGYLLSSIDPAEFGRLMEAPTPRDLEVLARGISDGLDANDGQFEAGDPVAEWPSDRAELARIASTRLLRDDWYGDLTATGKNIWLGAIIDWCQASPGFHFESQCYWDVVEITQRSAGVTPGVVVPDVAMSAFGSRPFRYHQPPDYVPDLDAWYPGHSLHLLPEVARMLPELESARSAIESAPRPETMDDFEQHLLPTIKKLVDEQRILFVLADY